MKPAREGSERARELRDAGYVEMGKRWGLTLFASSEEQEIAWRTKGQPRAIQVREYRHGRRLSERHKEMQRSRVEAVREAVEFATKRKEQAHAGVN